MSTQDNSSDGIVGSIEIPVIDAFELYRKFEHATRLRNDRDLLEEGSPAWNSTDGELLEAVWDFVYSTKVSLPDWLSSYYSED